MNTERVLNTSVFTEKEKQFLRNSKNSRPEYQPYIHQYIDSREQDIPANVLLLFEHIFSHKGRHQHAYMLDLDIYFVNYQTEILRKYADGWYSVKTQQHHHPKFKKMHK